MRLTKKIIAVFLTMLTLFSVCSVAMPVFAEYEWKTGVDIVDESYVQEEMTSKIVGEVNELREEYEKHFICEDGSYIVATYTNPVHYEENGQWKEINNNLELTTDVKTNSKAMYTPKSGPIDIKIPQSFSNGQKIVATNKGHTISFGVKQDEKVLLKKTATLVSDVENLSSNMNKQINNVSLTRKAITNSVPTESEITTYNKEIMVVENQASAVVYEDIFDNADLEYIVTSNSIKENIVVYEKQYDYSYSFTMDFGELIPMVNEDNSIRLVEPENTDETVFCIATPYMYDANENESADIDMSLVKENETYVLTLRANADWINSSERVFPVVIDPTVYLSYNDVFVMDGLLNKNTTKVNKELRVGRNLTNLTRTYIKPELPSNIPMGSWIENAYLVLKQDNYYQALSGSDIYIRAYDCNNVASWSPDSITWNNQPFDNSDNGYKNNSGDLFLSAQQASSNKTEYSFHIINAVKQWYATGVNNGIVLVSSNESSKTQVDFHSSRADDSNNYPELYICYTAPSITISNWETDSQAKESSYFNIVTEKAWTAYSDSDWLSLSDYSGTGYSYNQIIVDENTLVQDRIGTITVKMGNTVIGTITVTQLGVAPSLILGESNFFIKCSGDTCSVDIVSNVAWEPITESSWISFNKEQINSETYKLNISVSNNETFKTRTGEIGIISDDIESRVIKITQLDEISNYFYEVNEENTELALKGSSEYNHALATWAMYLSNAAYNPLPNDTLPNIPGGFMTDFTTIESVLTESCFEDIEQYHYEESQLNTSAHTIAHKKIIDTDGSYKTLITVTIRGTTAMIEWLTDVASVVQHQKLGFLGAKNDVIGNLNNYLQKYNSAFEDEKIILITGHSMGAAVANLVADALNSSEEWDNNNVYTYTFATPNVGQNITTEHINIFNILNRSDYVTLMPFSLIPSAVAGTHLWGRHGIDIPISMTRGENVFDNHKMDTYYNFMISQEPTLNYVGIKAISNNDVRMGVLPKLLSMKCPVGVTVYNSDGEIMAHESQQTVALYARTQTIATTSDVVSWITEDGEKVFFIPYGSDASLVTIEAYDYGNMTFSIANVDILNTLPNEIKTFKNVSLYPEKEFSVGISEYIPIEDTKLYVVENGIIVDEITDLNPPLKSVSLDNTNISYGTPSTLTIETDKTVSEIKFINTTDGTSVTYSANNGTGVTVFEDGNNLIWNVQKIFSQGSWIYDVAVKSEDAWYTTNKAFAVTVY